MAHDVFVSYPHEDKPVADAVVATLEGRGVRCWEAPRDVPPGAEWAGAIVDAIESSRLLVLVFSGTANDSDHILREVRAASDADVAIVPFRTSEVEPNSALRYYLGGTHWLDALTEPLEAHLAVLADRVIELLGIGEAADVVRPLPRAAERLPAPDARVPWWRRSPVGVGVAAALVVLGVAVVVGVIVGGSGSDDDPATAPAVANDGDGSRGDEPGESDDDAPGDDEGSDGIGEGGDAEPVEAHGALPAGASEQPFDFAFSLAIRDGQNLVCDAGSDGNELAASCRGVDDVSRGEDLAVADLDDDGTLDHAVAGPSYDAAGVPVPATNRICLTGSGSTSCADLSADRLDSRAIAGADVSGDGYLDIVSGNSDGGDGSNEPFVLVCLGDGDGGFGCRRSVDLDLDLGPFDPIEDIAVADVDLDSRADLVLAVWNGPNQVCGGVGGGDFVCEPVEDEVALSTGAAIADLDEDGHVDLVFTNQGTPNRRCLGRAGDTFDCGDISGPNVGSQLDVGDVNGDGALDLLIGRGDLTGASPELETTDQLCLGDGRGGFACEAIPEVASMTFDVDLVDLDDDGDLDYLSVGDSASSAACFGDGRATFSCTALPTPTLRDERGFDLGYLATAVAVHP